MKENLGGKNPKPKASQKTKQTNKQTKAIATNEADSVWESGLRGRRGHDRARALLSQPGSRLPGAGLSSAHSEHDAIGCG